MKLLIDFYFTICFLLNKDILLQEMNGRVTGIRILSLCFGADPFFKHIYPIKLSLNIYDQAKYCQAN